ncbi:hypothetical protein ABVK25_006912 [Lepraria finkii]|uniref:Uncharacterized protein n=1 Tax=Lepraria finkii TaxID=1340010 RepID=A0ABR4B467_9LECA
MSFLAPYTNAMRLGQGFNSYTQEICIENAVLIEPAKKARTATERRPQSLFVEPTHKTRSSDERRPQKIVIDPTTLRPQSIPKAVSENSVTLRPQASNESFASTAASDAGSQISKARSVPDLTVTNPSHRPATSVHPAEVTSPHKNTVQIVTYSSRLVDNVSDIVEALNLSSSASIKYGTIKGSGSTSIVNENKVNQSDLNYVVTVKVTNETSPVADRMTFNPIPEMENSKFTDVFGDCFISGFTEGGEFSAIISIKVSDKSKVSAVKAAAEAEIAVAAAPGLSVGTKNSVDRNKSDVWDDTETTISVNWAGGGDVKPADEKWDLKTVVDVATRFPHLVQTCAQRTSAILTRYTSLRSFNEANARNPPEDKFRILDYELCSIYTQDLFSGFLAYKNIWGELSDMLKHPGQYRERDPGPDVPNPIQLTPKGMNEARMLARKGMTQITDLTKALITEPSLADLDENGQQRGVPYMWPGELRKRLPIRHHGQTIREQADLIRRDSNYGLLTGPEIAKIGGWAQDDDLEFSPLVGDHLPIQRSWVDGKGSDRLFCTLDSAESSSHIDNLTRLRIHAHENRTVNWLGIFGLQTRSKRCHNHISGIGFSTAADSNVPPREDGIHHVVGKANRNPAYWGQSVADFRRTKASKVRIEYTAGSGCLAALVILDSTGQELTSWKSYGQSQGIHTSVIEECRARATRKQ